MPSSKTSTSSSSPDAENAPSEPSRYTSPKLEKLVKNLPTQPGVYRFWDKDGQLLYIGKAKHIRKRVKSYFQNKGHTERVDTMVSQIANIDTIVTSNEMEAFLLEANQIPVLKPRFNIRLRHDSFYPWLAFTKEKFPRLVVTRKPDSNFFSKAYGPYPSAGAMYQTLKVIKKIFPLRQRRKPLFKDRPCMNYHIGQCLAPCVNYISEEDYMAMVDQIEAFLKGRVDHVTAKLEDEMQNASRAMAYEQAALIRDRLKAIELVAQQQRMIVNDNTVDQDVVGCVVKNHIAQMAVLVIRRGKLINTHFFQITVPEGAQVEEIFSAFLVQFYQDIQHDADRLPKTILTQFPVEDEELLSTWLSDIKGQKVSVAVPKKVGSPKHDLVQMAIENAQSALERYELEAKTRLYRDPVEALMALQEALDLPQFPKRMECYDISHVSGTNTVASMVVFTDGVPDKAEYRRFKIQSTQEGKPDDFQSMFEVMSRRFRRSETDGQEAQKNWPDPDLVIIDGGKGQLSSACKALKEIGIDQQPIISLAKKFEEVFMPGQSRPFLLDRDSPALVLLQQIRDEAHRFAITYHRSLRGKKQSHSALDDVPGIGPKRKQQLLSTFKTKAALKAASVADIGRAIDATGKVAQKIYDALQEHL